ncbi:MAG: tRNA (adenosine(37)-N6)-threonylcarbamoyltransferase complex dimerization subunit type 1 TsaB [Alphaproteobacteria bacterium]|nr:tRNA (adenosine(37)-N6)-threonylcarbamoyltransferase complex dimerization subunit type 1 TsaB [Alphaproteobacteria bacterium]
MKILAFDSVVASCSAAIVDIEKRRALPAKQMDMDRGQAEILVPMLKEAVEEFDITFKDLNLVCCTVGPGSFTGVRVALSTAKAIGMSLEIPVMGVTSFEAIVEDVIKTDIVKNGDAYGYANDGCEYLYPARENSRIAIDLETNILVVLDTKRSDFYVQLFSANGEPECEPMTIEPEDVPFFLPEDMSVIIAGDAANAFIKCLDSNVTYTGNRLYSKRDITISNSLPYPDPIIMGHLAYYKYMQFIAENSAETKFADGHVDKHAIALIPSPPSPLYIRPPDAKLPMKK